LRRQNNSFKNILSLIFVGLIIAGGVFVYFSPQFEKDAPKITFKNSGFWNLKDSMSVSLHDKSGINSYKVYFKTVSSEVEILSKSINNKQTDVVFNIDSFALNPDVQKIKLAIEVFDNSLWNFFRGNKTYKEYDFNIDRKKPKARVISNSNSIKRGGSAAVVVKVHDENLKDKYITFNDKYKFELIPFEKKGYYAAVIAWPIDIEFDEFDRVNLVAIDKAQNKTVKKVPLYIKDLKIKKDNLKISDRFVNKVSIGVLEKSEYEVPESKVDIFVKQNRDLRANNIKTIKDESLKNMSKELIKNYSLKPFKRLSGSKTFAGFAEKRQYFYKNKKIDQAWHLGMDWASIKHADIKTSNSGEVIFSDYLGIYGNTLIVDHGLGVQSLYAHTSKFQVQKGDSVKRAQKIAKTGSTGAVFGDHLHFGMLVQGVEVNPIEWMDRNWLKSRILNILAEAKQEIRSSK